jgi:site-specific recombinase XerD
VGQDYKKFLVDNATPIQTTNRRLSTLRNLSRFMVATQIIDFDFMDGLTGAGITPNVKSADPILEKYAKHLESQKASKNTIKNYVADVKHFISWVNSRQLPN